MKSAAIMIIRVFMLRLKSDTPKFFKVIQAISLILAFISSVVVYLDYTTELNIPRIVSYVCEHLVAFAISMGLTSQLTSSDPSSIDEKLKKEDPQ